jgi:hypothetical protein
MVLQTDAATVRVGKKVLKRKNSVFSFFCKKNHYNEKRKKSGSCSQMQQDRTGQAGQGHVSAIISTESTAVQPRLLRIGRADRCSSSQNRAGRAGACVSYHQHGQHR